MGFDNNLISTVLAQEGPDVPIDVAIDLCLSLTQDFQVVGSTAAKGEGGKAAAPRDEQPSNEASTVTTSTIVDSARPPPSQPAERPLESQPTRSDVAADKFPANSANESSAPYANNPIRTGNYSGLQNIVSVEDMNMLGGTRISLSTLFGAMPMPPQMMPQPFMAMNNFPAANGILPTPQPMRMPHAAPPPPGQPMPPPGQPMPPPGQPMPPPGQPMPPPFVGQQTFMGLPQNFTQIPSGPPPFNQAMLREADESRPDLRRPLVNPFEPNGRSNMYAPVFPQGKEMYDSKEQERMAPAVQNLFARFQDGGVGSTSFNQANLQPGMFPSTLNPVFPTVSMAASESSTSDVREASLPGEVCAVLCGYVGSRYHGLQKHDKGPPTIEQELESALIKCGALVYESGITQNEFGLKNGDLSKVKWTHASRTDKGVHAVGQCIALSMQLNFAGKTWEEQQANIVKALNECLDRQAQEKSPPLEKSDIVVYGIKKVPKGFYDDRRLDPSLGLGITRFDARRDATGRIYEYQCPTSALVMSERNVDPKTFRISDEEIAKIAAVLRIYEGTHDFHNFTADKCSDEGPTETQRVVSRFVPGQKRVNAEGVEYLGLEVEGDSFIYHQIRKMVGLAIFALRYKRDDERVQFVHDIVHDQSRHYVPLAPSLGLMLDRVLFRKENKTHGGFTVLLDLEDFSREMTEFKRQRIYPEIDEKEKREQNVSSEKLVQIHSCMQHWLAFLERTKSLWGMHFQSSFMPGPTDLNWLFSAGERGSSSQRDHEGFVKVQNAIAECLSMGGGSMRFFPDFQEVFTERLRSRRPFSKAMREKLRREIWNHTAPFKLGDSMVAFKFDNDNLQLIASSDVRVNSGLRVLEAQARGSPSPVAQRSRGRGGSQGKQKGSEEERQGTRSKEGARDKRSAVKANMFAALEEAD